MDYSKIQRLLKDKDVSGDLASRMEFMSANQPSVTGAAGAASMPQTVKSSSGIVMPALILSVTAPETGVARSVYEFLLHKELHNMNVPSTEGETLPDGRLSLKIHTLKKMNATQHLEYIAELDQAKVAANDFARKREYDPGMEGTIELESGACLRSTVFGSPLAKGPDQPFAAGDFVFIVGLKPSIKYDVEGKSKYGLTWEFDGLMVDPNVDTETERKCWDNLAATNNIPNLSYAGGFGPHNRDNEAIEFEKALAGKKPTSGQNWRILYNQVPVEKRPAVEKLLVLLLYRANDGPTPGEMVSRLCVHTANPIWEPNWIGSKENAAKQMEYWKVGNMRVRATVLRAGSGELVNITISVQSKLLDAYGITSTERWAAVAPLLVPKCGGRAVCKLNLPDSVSTPENNPDMNILKPDGTYSLGAAYGASYRVTILTPDVAEGAVRAGLEIDAEATKFLLNTVYGTEDLSRAPPNQVVQWAKDNHLNNQPIKPVINVFEYCENVDKLARDGYRFFIVSKDFDKDHPNNEFFIDTLAKSGDAIGIMSRGLMGSFTDNSLRGYIKLPSKKTEYCVFAVRDELVAKYSQPPAVLTEEQFVEQMLAEAAKLSASNKRTLEEAAPTPVAKVPKPAEVASPASVAAASDEDDDEDEAYNPLAMATD